MKKIESKPGALMQALEDGPVLATVRAGNDVFRNYAKGVIDNHAACVTKYDTFNMHDHAVLVVGRGKALHGGTYFIIKNSWTT